MTQEFVVKRDGTTEPKDINKIRRSLAWAFEGLQVDYSQIFDDEVIESLAVTGIQTSSIQDSLASYAELYIESIPACDFAAARLLLQKILKEANHGYAAGSVEYPSLEYVLRRGVAHAERRIDPKLLEKFDLEKLDAAIVPDRDYLLRYMGMKTLYDRYFGVDERNETRIEAPQHFFMRVAMGLALAEENHAPKGQEKEVCTHWAIEFYNVYSTLTFMSSTPTLFNSGTVYPQLSSCFVATYPEDSLEGIFESTEELAQYSKFSGGTALDMTYLRAAGSVIRSTGGKSSGIVPYAKLLEQTMRSFDQGGKRPGVTCLYLETWHRDIFDLLRSVDPAMEERRSLRDVQIANWIPSLFIERVRSKGHWSLFSPSDTPDLHDLYDDVHDKVFTDAYVRYENDTSIPRETIKATDLWKAILGTLFNMKGKGWVCFKDEMNRRSPARDYGRVHSSNLCTEIALINNEEMTSVCNLGSVNMSRIKTPIELYYAVTVGVRMIDNAVEIGYLPHEKGARFNQLERAIGLGVMGWTQKIVADWKIDANSEEYLTINGNLMELISAYATKASVDLAKTKGAFPNFEKSSWARGELIQDSANQRAKELYEELGTAGPFADKNSSWHHDLFKVRSNQSELREDVKGGVRNSTLLAVAPTATIANICGTTPCIELPLRNIYSKDNMSGRFTAVSSLYQSLKGTEHEHLIESAPGVDQMHMVKACAMRQIFVDQSQSLNIFVTNNLRSGRDLSDVYMTGYDYGVKTFYYLRSEAEDVKGGLDRFTNAEAPVEQEPEPMACSIDNPDCEACQ